MVFTDHPSDLVPTSHIVQDYNYRTPLVELAAASEIDANNGGGIVEYGCHVKTPAEAEQLARVHAEEWRSRQIGPSCRSQARAAQSPALRVVSGLGAPRFV